MFSIRGPGSSVRIATDYELDGPGIEFSLGEFAIYVIPMEKGLFMLLILCIM
jgi:hypothetical protein